MLANCAKLSCQPMDDILIFYMLEKVIFYMLEKATDLTNYLTDVHYCGVHYIRSLIRSQATTKYEICGILKIEKAIDAMG